MVAALSLAAPPAARADDIGAAQSGSWSSPATWLNAKVPGAADTAFVGSTYPSGSASSATVMLAQNQAVNDLYLGNQSGTAGVLNLNGYQLTTGTLRLGWGGSSGAITRTGGGTLSVAGTTFVDGTVAGTSLAFAAGDTTSGLYLGNGATASTAAAGNVTGYISLAGAGNRLTLGNNLTLSSNLGIDAGSTVNAQNRAITANGIYLTSNNGTSSLQNRGTVTANLLYMSGQVFNFTASDAVSYLRVADGSTAATSSAPNLTGDVDVYGSGSKLTLGADLILSGGLNVYRGNSVDAQGRKITANGISIDSTTSPALLNRGAISTPNLIVAGQAFNLTVADSVSNFSLRGTAATTTLSAGIVVSNFNLYEGASGTTSATSNITGGVYMADPASRLTLGADLSVTGSVGGDTFGDSNAGTIDAQGHKITAESLFLATPRYGAANDGRLVNRGPLALNRAFLSQDFALTAADSIANLSVYGAKATLPAGTSVQSLSLGAGATATTVETASVTRNVAVSGLGSSLTLSAPLSLAGNLSVAGATLDAQGRSIAADSITVANQGTTLPVLANLGTLTAAGSYSQSSGSRVDLGAGASSLGRVGLSGLSTLGVRFVGGSAAQLTLTGADAGALGIDPGSRLAFTLDGKQQGVAFRWANPQGGDHVADLNGLINSGAVTIDLTNGAMANVFSQDGFTVLFQPVPEPATVLLAGAAGLAGWSARRRIRRRTESPNA